MQLNLSPLEETKMNLSPSHLNVTTDLGTYGVAVAYAPVQSSQCCGQRGVSMWVARIQKHGFRTKERAGG